LYTRLSHACYFPSPSHPPWFVYSNDIGRTIRIMNHPLQKWDHFPLLPWRRRKQVFSRSLLFFIYNICDEMSSTDSEVEQLHHRRTVTTWALEAKGSPLLEAVARERLLKTQQAGKRLSGCCGDLWIVEISGGAVITCSSESCVWVVKKCIHQSIPRL
jgi:hypothetical protein